MCWCDHAWWDRAVVTESLFQIDEPNTDKDTAALVPGEYVEVWETLGIRGCSGKPTGTACCWNDHSFVGALFGPVSMC